jgi:hypothetical protein
MVYRATVKLDEKKLAHIVINKKLRAFQESVHRARARSEPGAITILAPPVGAVKYPIRWTPAKNQNKPPNTKWGYYSLQKDAFYATNGFGKGIPTKRTGALQQGWTSLSETIQGVGTRVIYWNKTNYTQFVVGRFTPSDHMQQFHRNTGWQPVITKRDDIKRLLIQATIREFERITT